MVKYDTQWWLDQPAPDPADPKFTSPAYKAQEKAILKALEDIDFDTVLEIGCGFGRITKLICDNFEGVDYRAFDISSAAIDVAVDYLDGADVYLGVRDIGGWDHEEPKSDLVVCTEMLMHRSPEVIADDIELLTSLTHKYLLTVDWWQQGNKEAEGCYQHDYVALFGHHPSIIEGQSIDIPEARQTLWLLTVKEEEA